MNKTLWRGHWQRFFQENMRNLTKIGGYVLLGALQPKSGFLPEAGCGRPKILKAA
jgi:hypothetical protein